MFNWIVFDDLVWVAGALSAVTLLLCFSSLGDLGRESAAFVAGPHGMSAGVVIRRTDYFQRREAAALVEWPFSGRLLHSFFGEVDELGAHLLQGIWKDVGAHAH